MGDLEVLEEISELNQVLFYYDELSKLPVSRNDFDLPHSVIRSLKERRILYVAKGKNYRGFMLTAKGERLMALDLEARVKNLVKKLG